MDVGVVNIVIYLIQLVTCSCQVHPLIFLLEVEICED